MKLTKKRKRECTKLPLNLDLKYFLVVEIKEFVKLKILVYRFLWFVVFSSFLNSSKTSQDLNYVP